MRSDKTVPPGTAQMDWTLRDELRSMPSSQRPRMVWILRATSWRLNLRPGLDLTRRRSRTVTFCWPVGCSSTYRTCIAAAKNSGIWTPMSIFPLSIPTMSRAWWKHSRIENWPSTFEHRLRRAANMTGSGRRSSTIGRQAKKGGWTEFPAGLSLDANSASDEQCRLLQARLVFEDKLPVNADPPSRPDIDAACRIKQKRRPESRRSWPLY